MNMNMSDNDGKEITYVYDVTVLLCYCLLANGKISKSQNLKISAFILHIIYGKAFFGHGLFAICRSSSFYVLYVMFYQLPVTSYKK